MNIIKKIFTPRAYNYLFLYLTDKGWSNKVLVASTNKEAEQLFLGLIDKLHPKLYAGYRCPFKWQIRKVLSSEYK